PVRSGGPDSTTPTLRYPYLTGPGKSPSWKGARMVAYNVGGTDPENTNVSVPRLTPEYKLRTRTSSGPGGARVTGRSSPWPGRPTQKARASSNMKIPSD